MTEVAARPGRVAARALDILDDAGIVARKARVLIVGMAYKPGVADYRESPAHEIAGHLQSAGSVVAFHDPLVDRVEVGEFELTSVATPRPRDYDLVLLVTLQPGFDYSWLEHAPVVLDATYKTACGRRRFVV
jgi:UDP-N-acetyl-D-mannosaminuronate dehydrogenase